MGIQQQNSSWCWNIFKISKNTSQKNILNSILKNIQSACMFKIPQSLAAEETEVPPELVGRRQTAFPVVLTNPCAAPD